MYVVTYSTLATAVGNGLMPFRRQRTRQVIRQALMQYPGLCHRSHFWRRFITYVIFYWQSLKKKHLVSLNNHTYETHKCVAFWWLVWQKLVGFFPLWKLRDYIQWRNFFRPGRVIWLGQRSPTGQRRQRLIDAEWYSLVKLLSWYPSCSQVTATHLKIGHL